MNYTDGSGLKGSAEECKRITGGAVAMVSYANEAAEALVITDASLKAFEVPGRQTVPRAELYAATVAARAFQGLGNREGITKVDAAYIMNCVKQGEKNMADEYSQNADLRGLFAEARQNVHQSVMNVKSHNEKQLVRGEMDPVDYLGNLLADLGASVAAEMQLSGIEEAEEEKWSSITYCIALRLVEIEMKRKNERPAVVPLGSKDSKAVRRLTCEEAKQTAEAALRARAHTLYTMGGITDCTKCKVRRKDISDKWWSEHACLDGETEDLVSLGSASSESEPNEIMVSQEKRSVTRAQWAKARQRQKNVNKQTQRQAGKMCAQDFVAGVAQPQPGVRIHGVPFLVHRSHSAVYIGGYAACLRCGLKQSCGYKNAQLPHKCRGWMPAGTRSALKQLLDGKSP